MFRSVLFGDINKSAYDILKDGYSVDMKMTMKENFKGIHTTLDAKNCSGKVCSKVSFDYKPCKCCTLKKLSLENNGVSVADVDFTNLVKNTTFMIRTQQNISKLASQKFALGFKYMQANYTTDLMVDLSSMSYTTSATYLRGNVLLGCKVSGGRDRLVGSVDTAIAYKYDDIVLSAGLKDYATKLFGAVYIHPFRNVEIGMTAELPLQKEQPEIAFGFKMIPAKHMETRVKVDSKGVLSGYFKRELTPNMTMSGTVAIPMNNMHVNSARAGISMEMVL